MTFRWRELDTNNTYTSNIYLLKQYNSIIETKDLAKNVKELRVIRGMSQEYLAEELRVSLRTTFKKQ